MAESGGLRAEADLLRNALQKSIAPGTLKTYTSFHKRFLNYVQPLIPKLKTCSIPHLRNLFLSHLACDGKMKMLGQASAALSFFFGPQTGDPLLLQAAIIESSAREYGTPVIHRAKATEAHVDAIAGLGIIDQKFLVPAAMCCLMFGGFLRISEVCQLRGEHLSVSEGEDEVWSVRVDRSKTDQHRKGAIVKFRLNRLSAKCVRSALIGKRKTDWIFEKSGRPLSASEAGAAVKRLITEAELDGFGLTSHSFRGGAATEAVQKGKPLENIMRNGRWKTRAAFDAYVAPMPL